MSGIIPKEQLGGFTRWQISDFDGRKRESNPQPATLRPTEPAPLMATPPAPAPVFEEVPAIALPTAEELERIYEEARASGYQAGFDEGRQAADSAARATAEEQARQFGSLLDSLRQSLQQLDQDVADQLLGLATEIAAQVLRGSIAGRQDVLLPVVREAIAALPIHHAHITLRLNPKDAGRVKELLGEQFAQTGTQIIEDAAVSPGGCHVRAGASEVDATIETRWKRVIEAIGATPQAWLSP